MKEDLTENPQKGELNFGEKFNIEQCPENDHLFCTAISFILFFTNVIWNGRSFYCRTVLWSRQYHSSRKWQSGYAYADCDYCRSCHGDNGGDRSCSGWKKTGRCCPCDREYDHFIYDRCSGLYSRTFMLCPSDRSFHRNTGTGYSGKYPVSDDLLYRYSIYYSVQYYQFYFPGNGRFQKPDVFYRDCLYGKYCT